MRPLLLQGGRVIDPSRDFDRTTDVLVQDGKIAALDAALGSPDGVDVRDVRGKVVAPGLVDVHVHLRGPGNEDVETIASGTRAAVAGGFTAVCAMPNTDPVTDNQAAVGFIVRQAARAGLARVFPIGAISVGQRGEHLSEFGEMVAAGAVAVSDDGKPVVSSHLMRTALEYARTFGVPVADHCEEPTLATGGVMHEGLVSTRLGLKGIPAAAEEIMVGRDILLAELTGGHVHLCHMSTRGSVELIRRAKEQGLRVTAEVTPHHLTLTAHAGRPGGHRRARHHRALDGRSRKLPLQEPQLPVRRAHAHRPAGADAGRGRGRARGGWHNAMTDFDLLDRAGHLLDWYHA